MTDCGIWLSLCHDSNDILRPIFLQPLLFHHPKSTSNKSVSINHIIIKLEKHATILEIIH